jgi:putative ribosome biogenesis GTPase RsgA
MTNPSEAFDHFSSLDDEQQKVANEVLAALETFSDEEYAEICAAIQEAIKSKANLANIFGTSGLGSSTIISLITSFLV